MTPARARRGAAAIGVALVGTLAIGLAMRGFLAGWHGLAARFDYLLHAHSHLGYYGVLFPVAWLGWRRADAPAPGPRLLVVYGVAVAIATAGFVRAGYGPEAIAGSTVVGAIWLYSVWPLRGRARDLADPLPAVIGGVILAEACIPPIAIYLRSDPGLAYDFVATFLSLLLLAVIVPSALAARGLAAPWPLLLATAAGGAASLGIWQHLPARLALGLYAGLLVWAIARGSLPLHLRAVWLAVAVGLVAMAAGLLPNNRPVVLGAIHFLILAPVLGSLADSWLRVAPPVWAWWLGHAAAGLLAGPLVAQGIGAGGWTVTAAAIGGAGVVLWWGSVLIMQLLLPTRD